MWRWKSPRTAARRHAFDQRDVRDGATLSIPLKRHSSNDATRTGSLDDRELSSLAAAKPRSAWVKLGARLFGASLDRRLAQGQRLDTSRLLMERALLIGTPSAREVIARRWSEILTLPTPTRRLADARVPVMRGRVFATESQIREVISALMAPLSNVTGVAMSRCLLSDGSGPIYNPESTSDLSSILRQICSRLDPLAS